MKKVTVIVGEECSGKSRLAMELVKEFDPSEIVLVDGKNLDKTDQKNLMNFLNISKNKKEKITIKKKQNAKSRIFKDTGRDRN